LPIIICILCITGVIIGILAIYSNTDQKSGQSYFNGLETSPQSASTIVIGASYIKVPENATVITQVDRVIKDEASDYNVNTPPGQSPTSSKQLVPWMEGARVAELMEYANVHVIPITGVPIKKINGNWYGPKEKGNSIFEVDPSKAGANVIGVRVETNNDKKPVEAWFKANPNHRAILFHSAAYEPGYSLFSEFPKQVTGQDPRPIFIKQTSTSELNQIFNQIRSLWS
jgi:hypothetical protein